MLNLSPEEFLRLAEEFNVIPLYAEFLADLENPLTAFLKIKDLGRFPFLLESVEGGEKWARYSFLGYGGKFYFKSKGHYYELYDRGRVELGEFADPLDVLKPLVRRFKPYRDGRLPRFWGGLVGYVGYDTVKFWEPVPDKNPDPLGVPDVFLVRTDLLVVFDNLSGKLSVVKPVVIEEDANPEELYREAAAEIRRAVEALSRPTEEKPFLPLGGDLSSVDLSGWRSNFPKKDFLEAVRRAKRYIEEGDVIQVVLSQRFSKRLDCSPETLYRVLRHLNPSPYMFFLKFDDLFVVGASPEVLVRVEEGKVETRPIAGTRPRGRTPEEDLALERDLLADEKERAEHIMLVDLARNDLGKIAKKGSVKVDALMRIERYSHVMHIVSDVSALLEENRDVWDVLKATFPAGTVSGAPKVRAMQIIEELEPERRGIYAGAVGYVSFQNNADMAIAIRTAVIKDRTVFVQAGAGIVADSVPEREWEETVNKAKALIKAVELAERAERTGP
ncbi:MAG: anthranilate synthase component I [Aquificae bacterium]|nr:anthranilate synthase component I [Aquificota bacterium]